MQFATFIREARLEKKYTTRALADRAGFHSSYISLVEHGKKNPRIGNAIRLAKALQLDVGIFAKVDDHFKVYGTAGAHRDKTKTKGKRFSNRKKLSSAGT